MKQQKQWIGLKKMLIIGGLKNKSRIYMNNIKKDIRPFIVMDKDEEKAGIVEALLCFALAAASYPIIFESRRFYFYYGLFASIFGLLCVGICYLLKPQKNEVVFKIDENGVFFRDRGPHSFEWPELKQVSVRFVTDKKGKKTRLLFITTYDKTEYRFDIFIYVVSYVWTLQRLKKSIYYFSKGSVPFKYYPIWKKSS